MDTIIPSDRSTIRTLNNKLLGLVLVVKWLVIHPSAGPLEASSYKRKGINENEEKHTHSQKTDATTFVENITVKFV